MYTLYVRMLLIDVYIYIKSYIYVYAQLARDTHTTPRYLSRIWPIPQHMNITMGTLAESKCQYLYTVPWPLLSEPVQGATRDCRPTGALRPSNIPFILLYFEFARYIELFRTGLPTLKKSISCFRLRVNKAFCHKPLY